MCSYKMKTVYISLTLLVLQTGAVTGTLVNIAQDKPATASSLWQGFKASTAVDGNTVADAFDPRKIIHTAGDQNFAWWKVDLQREVQDAQVRIYFRTDYTLKRNGVKLYTSISSFSVYPEGQLCEEFTSTVGGADIPDIYNVTCTGRWRYVLLYTDTDNNGQGPMLDFGEVQVFVCAFGYYGPDCKLSCTDRKCIDETSFCDHVTGQCEGGCQAGYTGTDCREVCQNDFYGSGCSLYCTDRKCLNPSSDCNHVTGQCLGGCRAGYGGTDCMEPCTLGVSYGMNCEKSCSSRHCVTSSSVCDTQTGQCPDGCELGWTGVDCTQECPAGTFGYDCTSCSTRHCRGESDCPADGTCSQGCKDGWTGNTCKQACRAGNYGPGCRLTCGQCIGDNICHYVTGICPGDCQAGWRGPQCTQECVSGQYGVNCAQRCGQCNGTCDQVLGHCPDGCLHGFCGLRCDLNLRDVTSDVNIEALIGTFIGTLFLVLLFVSVVHLCLIRQGRLKWINSSDKNKTQASRDTIQMSNIARQSADVSRHAHRSSHMYNNDYDVLDPGKMHGNKDYDVIKQKEYENA